jgi:hypothetical protein
MEDFKVGDVVEYTSFGQRCTARIVKIVDSDQRQLKLDIQGVSVKKKNAKKVKIMKWRRYRFKTGAVNDPRPLIFNPKYPWWITGTAGDESHVTIVAYIPATENLETYWDDAYDTEFTEHSEIKFTDRFPRPAYFEG